MFYVNTLYEGGTVSLFTCDTFEQLLSQSFDAVQNVSVESIREPNMNMPLSQAGALAHSADVPLWLSRVIG